jgi:hypothetical protein
MTVTDGGGQGTGEWWVDCRQSCFGYQQLHSAQKMPSIFGMPCSGGKKGHLCA